jgi:hypothetical protein
MAIFAMSAAVILAAAEVATEALGIRELHRQYLAEAQRLGNTALDVPLLPIGIYLLIGTLVSGPYLAYKALSAWNGAEARHREAWLLHLQKEWLDRRRADPAYRELLASAARVEKLVRRAGEVDARLKALEEERTALERGPQVDPADRARRDRAREAAVAERKLLDLAIEELIEGPAAVQRQVQASGIGALFGRSSNGAFGPRTNGVRGQDRTQARAPAAPYRRPVPLDDDE